MPESDSRERLQPSLLDRLVDDEPDKRTEGRDKRTLSMRRLRECVLRDLTWLLNTGRLSQTDDLEEYPEAARSVINFGMRDLAGTVLSSADVLEIERELREVIVDFEPRIRPETLKVRVKVRDDAMSHNAMTFQIEGELWGQPLPQRLFLKTEVDLETGRVSVSDEPGR